MNKKFYLFALLLSIILLPIVAHAQPIDIKGIFNRITTIFFIIFDGLVVIMCAYAGIKYLTARGDPGKIREANNALIWALVGVAVGLLANFASGIVAWLLGI